MNDRFEKDVDTLLSGLKWEQRDANAVYAALKGEKPQMKRKFRLGLVIATLLVLLAAVALAIGLSFSPHYTALQTARKAIMEKYGLTTEMLQLYGEDARETAGTLAVVWHGGDSEFLKAKPMGDYSATVDGRGNASVAWTHDGAAGETYRDGDLSADVWGPKQLQMVLDKYAYYQQWNRQTPMLGLLSVAQQAERLKALDEAIAPCYVYITRTAVPDESDISEKDALLLAEQALKNTYGVTVSDAWQVFRFFQTVGVGNDFGRSYSFTFQKAGSDGAAAVETHEIWVKSPSGEVITGANALPAEVKSVLTTDPAKPETATPTKGLSQAQALAVANQLLLTNYHLTEDMLTLFTTVAAQDDQNGKARWTVAYLPVTLEEANPDSNSPAVTDWRWSNELTPKLGAYLVWLDAENGEMINAVWSLDGTQNTAAYTKSDWVNAKVYDAHILPWVLQLLRQNSGIIAKYPDEQTDWFSVEDAAAYDQAFRDAGFKEPNYNHGLPAASDLTADQAKALACQAMQSEYGLSQADIDNTHLTCEYVLNNGGEWRIGFYSEQGMGNVNMNAATGEIQEVRLDSAAASNG